MFSDNKLYIKYWVIYFFGILWLVYSIKFYIFVDDVTQLSGIEKIEDIVSVVRKCAYRTKSNSSRLQVEVSNNRIIDVVFRYDMCDLKERYVGKKIVAYVVGNNEHQVNIGNERAQTFEGSKLGDNVSIFMVTGFPVIWTLLFTVLFHRKAIREKKGMEGL